MNKTEKINFARVPDEEYVIKKAYNVPTVDDILKLMNKFSGTTSPTEFLSDVFKCGAIAISNKFDRKKYTEREEEYKRTINKYNKSDRQLIADIFANIYILLSNQLYVGLDDYLGKIYMLSNTSNSKTGQFFTPYAVSKVCADVAMDDNEVKKHIENDSIITMHEPTVGSGGMVLATADTLYNKYHFNISRNLFVECGDIDIRCIYMAYLQLSLAGIPATIYHRDGLSLETWDVWKTPPYLMQYTRFKKYENIVIKKG